MHCTICREGETLDLPSWRVREVTARTGRNGLYGGLRPARGLRPAGEIMARNLAKVRSHCLHAQQVGATPAGSCQAETCVWTVSRGLAAAKHVFAAVVVQASQPSAC